MPTAAPSTMLSGASGGGAACEAPRKYIDADASRLDTFRHSASFAKVLCYTQACAMAVRGVACTARSPARVEECCPTVRFIAQELLPQLHTIVDAIPLEDMAQQRFGNRAKRVFHARLDAVAVELMTRLAETLPSVRRRRRRRSTGKGAPTTASDAADAPDAAADDDDAAVRALAVEMAAYLRDAFGNATRLDYGTGHELHFVMLMCVCLAEHGDTGAPLLYPQRGQEAATGTTSADGSNADGRGRHSDVAAYELFALPSNVPAPAPLPADTTVALFATDDDDDECITLHALRQQFVFYVFHEYLRLVRRLQTHYSLEPAGSHGAWGLDDYHHIPYIFGAAQLIDAEAGASAAMGAAIVPADVCDKQKVARYAEAYMYFGMVHWVVTHKTGPFAEHSNMLYNISGVGRWAKIYSGMVKMYAAEVLSKFNVAQHILFGRHFPWNTQRLE